MHGRLILHYNLGMANDSHLLPRRTFLSLLGTSALASAIGVRADDHAPLALPDLMTGYISDGRLAGIVVMVTRDGKPRLSRAFGYEDIEARRPMRTDSIMSVSSITNVVTAIAVMCLVEESKVALASPVAEYLPEFANDSSRRITIQHLLTHTSGIPGKPPAELAGITRNLDRTLADVVAIVAKQPLADDPGAKWAFSGMGFATLGRVVEVVGKQPYQDFVRDRIFALLNMRDSFFFPPATKTAHICSMYNFEGGKLQRDSLDPARKGAKYPAPEAGLDSNAGDLSRLFQMMLNRGVLNGHAVLEPSSVATMLKPYLPIDEPGMAQGLGFFVCTDPEKVPHYAMTRGSFGHAGANNAFVWADPEKQMVRIFLAQRFKGGFDEIEQFMQRAATL